jgi:hypothetical protein
MSVAKRLYFDLPGFGRLHAVNGSITMAGDTATKEKSDIGSAGDSEEWMPGKLSFSVKNQPGVSVLALKQLREINVTVQDDSSKTWLCRGCSSTGETSLSGGDIKVEMEFDDQEEVV